jgi:hypothetical protein
LAPSEWTVKRRAEVWAVCLRAEPADRAANISDGRIAAEGAAAFA